MKVVIAGKSWIACRSLDYVVDLSFVNNLDVELLCLPSSSDAKQHDWQPSLRQTAHQLGVPIASSLGSIDLNPSDVLVSLEYDQIVKPEDLERVNAFNIHFSNLPRYRGSSTSVWPIRNGESTAGVTLHRMNPGIDDGPIIAQKLFPLDAFMTSFDLYKAYNAHGYELFCREFENLLNGAFQLHEQDMSESSTYWRRDLDFAQVEIGGFDRPAELVRDFVRSLVFPPYQLPTYRGRPVYRADVIPATPTGRHSKVADSVVNDRRALVQCSDAWLRLSFATDRAD